MQTIITTTTHPLPYTRTLAMLALGCVLAGPVIADNVVAPAAITVASNDEMTFNIPSGVLAGALETFSRQAGVPIVFDRAKLQGLTTSGLSGSYSPQTGLNKLLEGTGYVAERRDAGYALVAAPPAAA